ncbi:MAG: hypothetical protein QM811_21220 [Pirellulales bacterium]
MNGADAVTRAVKEVTRLCAELLDVPGQERIVLFSQCSQKIVTGLACAFGTSVRRHYALHCDGGHLCAQVHRQDKARLLVCVRFRLARCLVGVAAVDLASNLPLRTEVKSSAAIAALASAWRRTGAMQMTDGPLRNRRVLLVEDEALIALDLEAMVTDAGMSVAGPISTLVEAIEAAAMTDVDVAILDVNLQGDLIWPAAEIIQGRCIPIMFLTGYDKSMVPEKFKSCLRLQKPINSNPCGRVRERLLACNIMCCDSSTCNK